MSYLALFGSFEYLCCGSTAIRNIVFLSDFDVHVGPRTERVTYLWIIHFIMHVASAKSAKKITTQYDWVHGSICRLV